MNIDLEDRCDHCHGYGDIEDEEHDFELTKCSKCGGKGVIPTEVGKSILEFVKRHLGVSHES
jgi:DnaJ-class molecular chaperone